MAQSACTRASSRGLDLDGGVLHVADAGSAQRGCHNEGSRQRARGQHHPLKAHTGCAIAAQHARLRGLDDGPEGPRGGCSSGTEAVRKQVRERGQPQAAIAGTRGASMLVTRRNLRKTQSNKDPPESTQDAPNLRKTLRIYARPFGSTERPSDLRRYQTDLQKYLFPSSQLPFTPHGLIASRRPPLRTPGATTM